MIITLIFLKFLDHVQKNPDLKKILKKMENREIHIHQCIKIQHVISLSYYVNVKELQKALKKVVKKKIIKEYF